MKNINKNKIIIITLIILIGAAAGFGFWHYQQGIIKSNTNILEDGNRENTNDFTIADSFEDCMALNSSVTETLPRICTTADGKKFTENIGNMAEKENLIQVTQPKPNSVITSPTTVIGQARGSWFFEGEMPIILFDANNHQLGAGIAHAYSDWENDNFVPFDATFTFSIPATTVGTIILKKNNHSGDSSQDDQLIIPIRFVPFGQTVGQTQ